MFDVVIAYVVILLVLSTVTTAVLQLVQRVLPVRYWWLRSQLEKLYRQVTEQTVAPESRKKVEALLRSAEANPLGHKRPDLVQGPVVRRWLRAALVERNSELTEEQLPVFLQENGEFEPWWKLIEKQMSAVFRLQIVFGMSVALGLFLCWFTGLEAFGVAQHLSESPAEVQALISDANRNKGGSERKLDDDAFVRMVARELPREDESLEDESRKRRAQALVCLDVFLQATRKQGDSSNLMHAAALELRLASVIEGHDSSRTTDSPKKAEDPENPDSSSLSEKECAPLAADLYGPVQNARNALDGLGFGGYPLSRDPVRRGIGYVLMALLVALGAPLWFEVLSLLRLPLATKPTNPKEQKPGE